MDLNGARSHPAGHSWSDYWPALRWAYVEKNDGSEITGPVSAQVNSPDPHSIPWLLVTVSQRRGNGALSRVSTVREFIPRGEQLL
jgi:hypothetical protein